MDYKIFWNFDSDSEIFINFRTYKKKFLIIFLIFNIKILLLLYLLLYLLCFYITIIFLYLLILIFNFTNQSAFEKKGELNELKNEFKN